MEIDLFRVLFRSMSKQKCEKVDLDEILRAHVAKNPNMPWQGPERMNRIIKSYHESEGIDFSYGGWFEDRAFMWQGTYLQTTGKHFHLGVDINVPQGTELFSPREGIVLNVAHCEGTDVDWGTRLIIAYGAHAVIFGHLEKHVLVKRHDALTRGMQIGTVGTWPLNGNVFEHVHIQAMPLHIFEHHAAHDFEELDGYSRSNDQLAQSQYPEPLEILRP